jgi:hypothetical protein
MQENEAKTINRNFRKAKSDIKALEARIIELEVIVKKLAGLIPNKE